MPLPFTPDSLGDTLHQTALNLGITSVPGLTPAATVVLLYATVWFVPFLLCLLHTSREVSNGWAGRYREGGALGLVIGLVVGLAHVLAVALYILAAVSVIFWASPDAAAQYPAAKTSIALCTELWSKYFSGLSPTLRQAPVATLGCAIISNIAAGLFARLLAWPYLAARERRTRLLLSRIEAQQQATAAGAEERRGTIRYF